MTSIGKERVVILTIVTVLKMLVLVLGFNEQLRLTLSREWA